MVLAMAAVASGTGPTAGSEPPDASFEEVLARLQAVVERLEAGDLSLEEALAVFEEGVALSRAGAQKLDEAERRIEVLLGGGDGTQTRPLDVEGPGR